MKRASFIAIAIFAVLLMFPATMPSAKTPGTTADTPTIHIITSQPGGQIPGPNPTGDGDGGDGDGLAGIRDGTRIQGAAQPATPVSLAVKVWWAYLLFHRVF